MRFTRLLNQIAGLGALSTKGLSSAQFTYHTNDLYVRLTSYRATSAEQVDFHRISCTAFG